MRSNQNGIVARLSWCNKHSMHMICLTVDAWIKSHLCRPTEANQTLWIIHTHNFHAYTLQQPVGMRIIFTKFNYQHVNLKKHFVPNGTTNPSPLYVQWHSNAVTERFATDKLVMEIFEIVFIANGSVLIDFFVAQTHLHFEAFIRFGCIYGRVCKGYDNWNTEETHRSN